MSIEIFCLFMKRFFIYLILSCMNCLYILDINPLSVFKYFLPFCRLLFFLKLVFG